MVGFKNPVPKFRSAYVEIPVTSSVLLFDSVRTSNTDAENDLNRLLVGKYTDPVFGPVTATSFAQFAPASKLVTLQGDTVELAYASIELQLFVDFYVYGSDGTSVQKFTVHPLINAIPYTRTKTVSSTAGGQQKPVESTYRYKKYYNAEANPMYNPTPVGSGQFTVDAAEYKEILSGEAEFDSTYVTVPLDDEWGFLIFDLMTKNSFKDNYNAVDKSSFTNTFKGISIVPTESDKIVGFFVNPDSRIRMTYIERRKADGSTKKTHYIDFPLGLGQLVSFNSIVRDFTGSPLEGLTTPYQEFDPGNDLRYIISGSRVVTKIDFSKFVDFANSDSISRLAINSAEFVIKNVEEPGGFDPPENLVVKLIQDDNRAKKLAYPGRSTQYTDDLTAIGTYQSMVNFDYRNYSINSSIVFDSTYNVVNDLGGFLTLNYSEDTKSYSGTASLFFQQLFQKEEGDPLFTKAILLPYTPSQTTSLAYGLHTVGKSVNRVAFNKDNIVLRIYYTVPTVN